MATKQVIALTGGIGSGKSTVAQLFADKGAHIIDADILAREVVAPGQEALREIIQTFGKSVVAADGTLERKALAERIFADSEKRLKLEAILHPRIRGLFLKRIATLQTSAPFILYVVPLFYETQNPFPEVSRVVVVWAPIETCVSRIITRDGLTREQALQRVQAQLPLDLKAQRADWVIRNDGQIGTLKPQVEKVYSEIINLCYPS